VVLAVMAAQVNKFNKLINIKGEINMNKKLVVEVETLKASK
jgi:hypothetical protein